MKQKIETYNVSAEGKDFIRLGKLLMESSKTEAELRDILDLIDEIKLSLENKAYDEVTAS